MKILLLELEPDRNECINKDFMAGFGWAFNAGNSLGARFINWLKKRGETLPVISFAYIAAIFKSSGHEVLYRKISIKTNNMPVADLVLIASSIVDYRNETEWAQRIRDSGIQVGFIGVFASKMPELFLPHCNFVIQGEPEEACIRIARGEMPVGIIESMPIENLDSLEFPYWDIFPHQNFSYLPVLREKPFFPILSSRGCAFKCTYCPYPAFYEYRSRSVENVLAEIEYMIQSFGMKGVLFRDPLFTGNRERSAQIAQGMIRNGLHIRWACETRIDFLDEELLLLFYKSGCRVINVGIESSDPALLEKAKRNPVDLDYQKHIVDFADKLGIRITAFYLLGLPGETPESIARTIAYSQWLNTYVAQFFINTPFPGTPGFELVKNRIIESDWERFDSYTPVLSYDGMTSSQLSSLKEQAFISYYYRPKYLWKYLQRTFRDFM